jgi:hypothetical protein
LGESLICQIACRARSPRLVFKLKRIYSRHSPDIEIRKIQMKRINFIVFLTAFLSAFSPTTAQTTQTNSATDARRPRIVVSSVSNPTPTPPQIVVRPNPTVTPSPTPSDRPVVVVSSAPTLPTPTPSPVVAATPVASPSPALTPNVIYPPAPNVTVKGLLTIGQFRASLAEAKRFLQSRPMQTASIEDGGFLTTEIVTLAALDPKTKALHTIALPKKTFLTLGYDNYFTSSLGKLVRVRTLRANGVNTAVTIYDTASQPLVPLVVQYPIEKGGRFTEMAYYTSAHPAIMSAEVSRAGQIYLRTTFETALKKLKERGKFISPHVVAAAEDLAIIEHVDHFRFLSESRSALYDEILALFALNEGGTYRYAVSSAGAGGLVQMIPATYRLVRSMHPNVPLMPDFVTGMRDHVNAAQAMLLYMQDTWNDLSANETINYALQNGLAKDHELMAAGYNSNPARLPAYIRRGGANWRYLIPRETQMYLQIQQSVQTTVKKLPPIKQ